MDINQILVAGTMEVKINGKTDKHYAIGIEDSITATALTGIVGQGDDEESKEDARRLAACWNACRAIPTEHLEKQGLATINISAYADAQRFEWFINNILAELDPEYAGATIDEIRALIDKQRSK